MSSILPVFGPRPLSVIFNVANHQRYQTTKSDHHCAYWNYYFHDLLLL